MVEWTSGRVLLLIGFTSLVAIAIVFSRDLKRVNFCVIFLIFTEKRQQMEMSLERSGTGQVEVKYRP